MVISYLGLNFVTFLHILPYKTKKINENLFVPYKIALKLKSKGFDEECIAEYVNGFLMNHMQFTVEEEDKDSDWSTYKNSSTNWFEDENRKVCSAPLYQQVLDWFREKHNTLINVEAIFIDGTDVYQATIKSKNEPVELESEGEYYEMINKAIGVALKLI